MGFRNIFLLNPAKISVKNEQLIFENETKRTIPLEDIECIAVDNLQTNFSSYALMKIAEYGISMYISDNAHQPTAVILPTNQHTRHLKVLKQQLDFSKPELKRLWQQIVIRKIENQAKVLKLLCQEDLKKEDLKKEDLKKEDLKKEDLKKEDYKKLDEIKLKVKSGDSENMEAVAAAFYFKSLFGSGFSRSNENIINAFLNYGYAIIRNTIEKNLCVYGFEPALGIFHHSELNNFNLADDLIETYRPVVDLFVAQNVSDDLAEFSSQDRAKLLNLLNVDICLDNKKYSVAYAIERTVQSFSGIINGKNERLFLPEIIPIKQHEYE